MRVLAASTVFSEQRSVLTFSANARRLDAEFLRSMCAFPHRSKNLRPSRPKAGEEVNIVQVLLVRSLKLSSVPVQR